VKTTKTYTEPAGSDPATSVVTTTKNVTTDPGPAPANVTDTETHKPLGGEAQCRTGTAYVEGSLNGKVTLVADNSVIVTDHLTYSDDPLAGRPAGSPDPEAHGTSVLGLISANSVLVYHPITCRRDKVNSDGVCTSGTELARHTGTAFENPTIHASMLTLQHSIAVQAYQLGKPLGMLTLFGSMAQRFRGAVATGSGSTTNTGYKKDYVYDENLKFDPPPHFLDPTSGGWGSTRYAEIAAAYRP
jgi:hypothetical protein